MRRIVFALLVLLVLLDPASANAAQRVALVGATLVDGTLSDPIHDSAVLIEGERIVAVGRGAPLAVPADAEMISTEGMTVLPGLRDMHVHLMISAHMEFAAPSTLEKS